jgi:hypothetical protein
MGVRLRHCLGDVDLSELVAGYSKLCVFVFAVVHS